MKIASLTSNISQKEDIFFSEPAWLNQWDILVSTAKSRKRCGRCLFGEDVPDTNFDGKGICEYCRTHDELERMYGTGETAGRANFERILKEIKAQGRGKEFDVIVGVSGGTDSSYLIHLAKEEGLRPLAVHYDNTWNTSTATTNIHRVLSKLGVPLETYVVDNREYDDLYRSFLKAGVMDLDCPTDIGLATVLNQAAEKRGLRYILEGHSYRTEGLFPKEWLYMDARYIASVQKKYGTLPLKTFPNLWLSSQLRWMLLRRLRKIRPFWYLPYEKSEVQTMLEKTYGWQWYGGHHLENRMTQFFHTYFVPRRFGIDTRIAGYAALVRSGQMGREEALEKLWSPPTVDLNMVTMILKRWNLSEDAFRELMALPVSTYREFATYKPIFKRYRWFFYLMAKGNFIPMSFYLKYTK